jgi:uncharacterized protein (DUF1778 family)
MAMARQKKKPADKRTNCLRTMLTAEERKLIDRAASVAGEDTSSHVRRLVLDLIRKGSR